MQRYTIFFIVVSALYVSDGFSVHHQELKIQNCTQSIWYVLSLLAATASVWVTAEEVCPYPRAATKLRISGGQLKQKSGRMTLKSRRCRWCVQCGGNVTRNVLLKWGRKTTDNVYATFLYKILSLTTLTNLITYSSWETNLSSIVFWAAVLNRYPCFQLISIFTDHIYTKFNMIH
jgi:hypothetical protein